METFIDTQEWVPVHTLPGFECCIEYYVNRNGQVKSTKGRSERILKNKNHKSGYPMVSLTQRLGKKKTKYCCVHTLVAFAFLGNPPTPYGRDGVGGLPRNAKATRVCTQQYLIPFLPKR